MISAPYMRSSWVRSAETFSGITQTSRYPRSFATMASAMPVFPLVGSRIVSPGLSWPAASAARIIHTAGRSLIEPVGLRSSSFAHSRTCVEGDSLGRPISGVSPHASNRLSYLDISRTRQSADGDGPAAIRRHGGRDHEAQRTTGDGGQDRNGVAVTKLGVQCPEETDVLVVDVDVHEPVQRTLISDEPAADPRELAIEVGQQVGERLTVGLHGLLTVSVGAQDSGNANFDGHIGLLLDSD
jgi:hypothetical protein